MRQPKLNRRRVIFSPTFCDAIEYDPIVLVDVGARGGIEEPWSGLSGKALKVIGFEPDQEECDRLNGSCASNRKYLPVGLWSGEGTMNIHCADTGSCSSVHPPHFELLKKYHEKHWKPRVTKQVARVTCTTLDKVMKDANLECDFLKIDTQGSEYEVLQGAQASLKTSIFGVLVETWTSEVHKGQHLTGDVLTMMADLGFALFDINVAAAWKRRHDGLPDLQGKAQITGLDLLFFRESNARLSASKRLTKVLKAAAVAEVYGFPDYAVELLSAAAESNPSGGEMLRLARDMVIQNFQPPQSVRHKVQQRLRRLLGIQQVEFPSLHY